MAVNIKFILLSLTMMFLCREQLFTVRVQQLALLCDRCPVKHFAFLSSICPDSATLTYLLEENEFALEIIS